MGSERSFCRHSKEYFQPYTLDNKTVEGSYEHVTGYNFTATLGVKF